VVARRRTNEQWEEYCALIDKAAALLLAKTAEMGILAPPGQMAPGAAIWGAQLGLLLTRGAPVADQGRSYC